MFKGASEFNGDVSGWNTAAVTNMSRMFEGASAFNGDVSGWNTAAVKDMRSDVEAFPKEYQRSCLLLKDGQPVGLATERLGNYQTYFY
jgi:surface protein